MGIVSRYKRKAAVLQFMQQLKFLTRAEMSRATGVEEREFYDGVLFAIVECQQSGAPQMTNWLDPDQDTSPRAQGYGKSWQLMTIATLGANSPAGVPPVVVPTYDPDFWSGDSVQGSI